MILSIHNIRYLQREETYGIRYPDTAGWTDLAYLCDRVGLLVASAAVREAAGFPGVGSGVSGAAGAGWRVRGSAVLVAGRPAQFFVEPTAAGKPDADLGGVGFRGIVLPRFETTDVSPAATGDVDAVHLPGAARYRDRVVSS